MTILPPPVTSADPERQKALPRTCRCLDYCLVITVMLLTLVVGSMCVYYMAWERQHQEKMISERIQRDRLRNSAQLTVDSVQIVDMYIKWNTSPVDGVFLGPGISYNDTTQELLVKNEGYYFIYSQITLICVDKNHCTDKGNVSISVLKDSEETIQNFDIPNRSLSSYSAKIQHLPANTKLKVQLKPSEEMKSWQLDQNSFMGLFLFSEHPPGAEIQ